MKSVKIGLIFGLILIALVISCRKTHYFRDSYRSLNELMHDADNLKQKGFLKAHFRNGNVCILNENWAIDSAALSISGTGKLYDYNRNLLQDGSISFVIDSIAIFETNRLLNNPEKERIAAFTFLTGLDALMGVFCLSFPKACFGSCPTFYINQDDNFHYADAEGFSNAIAPSLEYHDIDALQRHEIKNGQFSLFMKNEALETHCINEIKLLAFPVAVNEKVYQSPENKFYSSNKLFPLNKALSDEGDISHLLSESDRNEWFSLSDAQNLASKEEIHLSFKDIPNSHNLGLVLHFRQTLMTTYFIYSAMGYMGDEVGDIFTQLDRDPDKLLKLENGIYNELGKVDVYVWNDLKKEWILQGGFYETGPIAINKQILPLKKMDFEENLKVKLVLNKGLWRIDHVSLADISGEAKPMEIQPESIVDHGKVNHQLLQKLAHPEKYLISMPGDSYEFKFLFPDKSLNYELFLYSKGYYLEWMRESWLKDKNLFKLRDMVEYPKKYLKDEANEFKKYEHLMEEQFWGSKIPTHVTNNVEQ